MPRRPSGTVTAKVAQLRDRLRAVDVDWDTPLPARGKEPYAARDWLIARAVLRDGTSLEAAAQLPDVVAYGVPNLTRERIRQIVHRTARRLGIDTSP
jgi:hypothetical protein